MPLNTSVATQRRARINALFAIRNQFNSTDLILLLLVPAWFIFHSPMSFGFATWVVMSAWVMWDFSFKNRQASSLGIPRRFRHLWRSRHLWPGLVAFLLLSGVLGGTLKINMPRVDIRSPFLDVLIILAIATIGLTVRKRSFRILDGQRVLFLRRFGEDSQRVLGRVFTPVTWHLGSCVSLLEPGVSLPQVLGRRIGWVQLIQVSDDEWRARAALEMRKARVLIIDVTSPSPALSWELDAAHNEHSTKMLIIARSEEEGRWALPYGPVALAYGRLDEQTFRQQLAMEIVRILERMESKDVALRVSLSASNVDVYLQ